MSGKPTIVPVGPRAGKDEFMRALGLIPGDSRHEGIYRNMRDEAIQVYNEINASRENLKDEQKNDPNIKNPFFWHHIRDECRSEAIRRTWQNAPQGSAQRHFFDLGSTTGDHGPNWVTLWLLYSVFRSRDIRNNRSRRAAESSDSNSGNKKEEKKWFDPARDTYVPV